MMAGLLAVAAEWSAAAGRYSWCLAALADEEKLLTELFQYRFRAGMV